MSELKLVNEKALRQIKWYSHEIIHQEDLNGVARGSFKALSDILALLAGGDFDGAVVIEGLDLVWSTALTSYLQTGVAVCFDGTYGELSTFAFSPEVGKPFAVMVPTKAAVAVDSGSAGDRYDTIEIRPKAVEYEQKTRDFKDPDTGVVTPTSVNTRVEYGYEFQVLKGTSGGGVAPTHTAGWVKLAEVFVAASASVIDQDDIVGYALSKLWTAEANETVLWSVKAPIGTGWPILVDHVDEGDEQFDV